MRDVSMKVAVIYSGEPRTFNKVVDSHDSFFEGLDVDTYHSTWLHVSERDKAIIKIVGFVCFFINIEAQVGLKNFV